MTKPADLPPGRHKLTKSQALAFRHHRTALAHEQAVGRQTMEQAQFTMEGLQRQAAKRETELYEVLAEELGAAIDAGRVKVVFDGAVAWLEVADPPASPKAEDHALEAKP